jgi:hypothetical protein
MPVVGHDAESDQSDAEFVNGFIEDRQERHIITSFSKDQLSAVRAIHDVMNRIRSGIPTWSCHVNLVPHRSIGVPPSV